MRTGAARSGQQAGWVEMSFSESDPSPDLSIGIVVPVYNEAGILADALGRLRDQLEGDSIIVIDGGSRDDSASVARRYFHTVILPEANRGAQLNHGARCIASDVLLFLHADSRLPAGFQTMIRRSLADPQVVGGCFRLEFDAPRAFLRFYSWCTRFPGRFLHFGDQAFFVRREVFEEIGGYRDIPLLEDVDFLRRVLQCGTFALLPMPVVTSARRFLEHGTVRQMLWNIGIVALFELGVSAERLARFYPHIR